MSGDANAVSVVVGRLAPLILLGLAQALREDRDVALLEVDLGPASLGADTDIVPDVVIVDETVDFSLLVRLKMRHPAPAVLVLARRQDELYRTMLLGAGAIYLPWRISGDELRRAVKRAAWGKSVSTEDGARPSTSDVTATAALTDREAEIASYLSLGWSYATIARRTQLAESTIKTHSAHVRRKLGKKSKQELIGVVIALPKGMRQ